ncbi:hypothetical protein GCM10011348_17090 [Marinobacterium nitratireducens]|uniref:Uncharacterized protein n=1 Tax=Marinobacterium nitratireducens TaxID=518897 RepID=A0A917ZCA2_9GAMM|nr:hypothetical protein [Marinobacterium nitratireducens]GGO80436.1 hypothetical protein GCM10011348_17090 [Marinobacterium nitratireducens]
MNLDNLPTDNLYKFVSLGGLVLVLFSLVYLRPLVWEQKIEVAKLAAEVKFYRSQEAKEEMDVEKLVGFEIKLAELREKNLQIKDLLLDARVLLYLGGFLTLFGFNLWYIRVQRPNDKILSNEANK